MITLAAVVVASACSLPPDARIVLESPDPACSTYAICRAGEPVRFRITSDADCPELQWSFGDGSVSADREPEHVFPAEDYHFVTLVAGIHLFSIGVDTRPNRYDLYALAASPKEISVPAGQTIEFTVSKKYLPNAGVFTISCGGAIRCAQATIQAHETSVTFTATALHPGAGGLSYYTYAIGGRPQGGGPFAMVRVTNPPKRRAVGR